MRPGATQGQAEEFEDGQPLEVLEEEIQEVGTSEERDIPSTQLLTQIRVITKKNREISQHQSRAKNEI